ncbi:MAG: flavodoxin family protein [Chloroflexi bacterium]|nr:flavodoxin family protein [Chloroflexota bacterium]
MKVLGIACSPRKEGSTEVLVKEALGGAADYGAETGFWSVAGKELKPCDACTSCRKTGGRCHIEDDMQELYPLILAADGLIFGSPVYFECLAAQAKIVLDRLYCLYYHSLLVDKVAGAIAVATAYGHDGVRIPFQNFFEECHMMRADFVWGYARRRGDVTKDSYAIKASEELGKQVAALAQQRYRLPEEFRKPIYRSTFDKYGIDCYPLKGQE